MLVRKLETISNISSEAGYQGLIHSIVTVPTDLQCHVDGHRPVHVEEDLSDAQQDEGHHQMVLYMVSTIMDQFMLRKICPMPSKMKAITRWSYTWLVRSWTSSC